MTNQPPWAVDDPLGAARARRLVRWDQRTMAALAGYYLVLLLVVLGRGWGDFLSASVVALPLLIRNRAVFAVVASATGLLLLAAVCFISPLAPAGLPLLLAQIRLPARAMAIGVPVLFVATVGVLSLLAWVFTFWP